MGFGGPVFGGGSAPATLLLAMAATTIWAFLGYLKLEGRPAARVIATYLFCLYSIPAGLLSLSVLSGLESGMRWHGGDVIVVGPVLGGWLLGLAAVGLMFRPPARDYYTSKQSRNQPA